MVHKDSSRLGWMVPIKARNWWNQTKQKSYGKEKEIEPPRKRNEMKQKNKILKQRVINLYFLANKHTTLRSKRTIIYNINKGLYFINLLQSSYIFVLDSPRSSRIWLNLTSPHGYMKQIILFLHQGQKVFANLQMLQY